MKTNKTILGFTLLELLVVISIIGILVAISAVSFSTAQRQSRDSRRRGDIKAIQNAFEQYNSKNNGLYDVDCAGMLSDNLQGTIPTDPKTGIAYTTTSAECSASAYCVCTALEQTDSGNASGLCATTTAPYASGVGADYWCASNLQ